MKLFISPSKIERNEKGLFSGTDVPEGSAILIEYEKQGQHTTKFFIADYRQAALSKLIADSDTPNTFLQLADNGQKIIRLSKKEIKIGEELTKDPEELKKIIAKLG